MALSRLTTWSAGQLLTASALNNEFDNILNNPLSLISTASVAAKGLLLVGNGSALTGVSVGTDNQVLTADSTQASGVKWTGSANAQTPWATNINAAGYTLYGNSTSGGTLTIDSTSHATKGTVSVQPGGGDLKFGGMLLTACSLYVTNVSGTIKFCIGSGASSAFAQPAYSSSFATAIAGASQTLATLSTSFTNGVRLHSSFNWILELNTGATPADKNIFIVFLENNNTGTAYQVVGFAEGGYLRISLYDLTGTGKAWNTTTIGNGQVLQVRILGFVAP